MSTTEKRFKVGLGLQFPDGTTVDTATGLVGATGPQGPTGNDGATGATGLRGATGVQGDQGATGVQGIQGATGVQGNIGATGAQGDKGDKGDTGNDGATGATGPQGNPGQNGTSVVIIGSEAGPVDNAYLLTTYPTAVAVNGIIDESTGYLWVFGGETWASVGQVKGDQGLQGATGATGPKGDTGDVGATGVFPGANYSTDNANYDLVLDNAGVPVKSDYGIYANPSTGIVYAGGFIANEGTGAQNGFSFNEGAFDTGMYSSGDGNISFYNNATHTVDASSTLWQQLTNVGVAPGKLLSFDRTTVGDQAGMIIGSDAESYTQYQASFIITQTDPMLVGSKGLQIIDYLGNAALFVGNTNAMGEADGLTDSVTDLGTVRIRSYDNDANTEHVWTFNAAGNIVFPDASVQSTAFTGTGDIRFESTWIRNKDTGNIYISPQDGQTWLQLPSDTDATSQYVELANSSTGGIRINSNNNGWLFNSEGVLTFPDSTTQSTAWTGSVAYSAVTGTPTLATVATSGAYSDLSGTPSLAAVATSGAYSDLSGSPTNVSFFSNDAGYLVSSDLSGYVLSSSLAAVATSGAYSDLSGTPSLAAVATSGAYSDLTGTPSITKVTLSNAGADITSFVTTAISGTGVVNVAGFDSSSFSTAKYLVSVIENTGSGKKSHSVELIVNCVNGDIYETEYGITTSDELLGDFASVNDGGTIRLKFTPAITLVNTTVKVVATLV